jgi:small subunit ribosomal protein S1
MNNPHTFTTLSSQEDTPALFNDPDPTALNDADMDSMASLLEASPEEFDYRELEAGDILEGEIVGLTANEILVDIGSKSEGVIPARDLDRVDPEIRNNLKVGDKILVHVVRPENREGHAWLSLSRALQEYDWRRAEELLHTKEVFEGVVSEYNKGGVIV